MPISTAINLEDVKMQETVYDKLRKLKDSLRKNVKEYSDEVLFRILGRCERWYYPKKRTKSFKLLRDELEVYEFLIENGYNPSTCYKWMLACSSSGSVGRQLREGTIGIREALRGAKPFKQLSRTEAEFLFHVKACFQKYLVR